MPFHPSLLTFLLLLSSATSLLRTSAPISKRSLSTRCRASGSIVLCAEDPLSLPFPERSLEATLSALHSKSRAAADQQHRLRKVVAGAAAVADAADADRAAAAQQQSTVFLVGVGPGDVELLTIKALRLMRDADLVLYDRLISPEILELVGPEAAMLYVGKEAGLHTRPQEEIHELLLHFASSGKTVVRLKGGDPTVFGRGGEEMEYLERQGVEVKVVPGVTAAAGIAASLGVPLTHRDHADSVRFITGHARSECSASVEERYHWAQLADPKTTLVIYMGLSTLPALSAGLVDAGLTPSTPAIAVQDGTTITQRVVAAPLGELAEAVEAAQLRSPTLVLIGAVVSLYDPATAADVAVRQVGAASTLACTANELLELAAPRSPP
uniref:uroporphyrinogen-III C-methyltransferase n=1 Tax=Haptolina brevifila TaxID=156173 RepID=A0A7S2IFK0_9EUKA|mmetsp:Transcript_65001/g.128518  ORF Transcript_65001/g.128518 Transcript_65001/m.128518 type:complete len:383 (+) Transcript_65001:71-1219(+)